MALSKCKCGSMLFEMVEKLPKNSSYKLWFVQCSSCGCPIGVMEYFVNFEKINNLKKEIENLDNKLNNIEFKIDQLLNKLK